MDKIIKYGLIAFLIFFVVTAPTSAADIINKGVGWLEDIGQGFSDFASDTIL